MKKILFLLIALASLTACSDDVVESVSSSSTRMKADVAYLTVKIIDVGSLTRATDGSYQNGTEAEYAVSNAYFYFYDEDGLFASRAEVWDEGAENTTDTNIEFNGNTVVVLKGLTDTYFPRYMVTVLNRPEGFEDGQYSDYYDPAGTLEEMQIKLASEATVGINDEDGNFVMSTSSYWAEDGASATADSRSPYYFVTEIPERAFQEEPIPADESVPVEVFVERLAAKVEVGVDMTEQTAETITDAEGGTHIAYPLTENIIGDDNVQTQEDIYIEFQGWALNATARQSYIVKNIESTTVWTNSTSGGTLGFTWNDPGDYRSFWGMSYNYGIDAAYPTTNINPTTGEPNTDADEDGTGTQAPLNEYLKYTSLEDRNLLPLSSTDEEGNALTNYTYCAENTNTADILGDSNSSAITSVLLKARGWHVDDNVASPITLIRYIDELYTEEAFLNAVAIDLDQYGEDLPNYYYSTSDEDTGATIYTLFNGEFLDIVNEGDGAIGVEANETAIEENTWYTRSEVEGEYVYTSVNAQTVLTNIASACESFNTYWSLTGDGGTTINEYADGLMYYNIPIEHLNESNKADGVYDGILEANYGVVRNHWYSLTINSLSRLGRGIVDEDEVIIPTIDDTNYLRASVSILPWKLIENTVIF